LPAGAMKQARRKELKTNELSVQLQNLYASVERNSTLIIAVVLAFVAIFVICLLIYQRRENNRQAGWAAYHDLQTKDPSTSRDALDNARQLASTWGSDRSLGPAVLALKGTMEHRLAMSLPDPQSKDQKIQLLKEASGTYKELLDRFGDSSQVKAQALMSLAGLEESLAILGQGSPEKVRQYYQDLVSEPNTYTQFAKQNLAQLDERLKPIQIIATRPAATLPKWPETMPAETMPAGVRPPQASRPSTATAPATTQPR
jgi:hypothetical protein